jgi:hypothetical protein
MEVRSTQHQYLKHTLHLQHAKAPNLDVVDLSQCALTFGELLCINLASNF